MTLSELVTELESKEGVVEVQTSDPRQVPPFSLNFVDVRYIQDIGEVHDHFQFVVIDFGTHIEFYKRVPPILQTSTQRDPHRTETQYITGIEAEFPGWKVLDLNISIRDDLDYLNVTASNGTEVINRRFAVWLENDVITWQMFEGQEPTV